MTANVITAQLPTWMQMGEGGTTVYVAVTYPNGSGAAVLLHGSTARYAETVLRPYLDGTVAPDDAAAIPPDQPAGVMPGYES